MLISALSSLFQVTMGLGLPFAVHSKVTLLPSVLTLSPLLRLSSILGGTEKKGHQSIFSLAFSFVANLRSGTRRPLLDSYLWPSGKLEGTSAFLGSKFTFT